MATLQNVLVVVFLGLFCQGALSDDTCKNKWKDFTDAVTRGTKDDFVRYINPLAQMSKKTYTGEVDDEITGWQLVQEFKLSHGLYALAYQCESDKSKIVVAFRGVRFGTDSFEGMRSDLCARLTLMSAGKECSDFKTPLPHICDTFDGWQLDYLNQARIFMAQLRAVFKEECILYTGHSLGSTLAALMSASSRGRSLAIGFSSNPSNLDDIVDNVGIQGGDFSNVIIIYDKYDSNAALESSMVGVTCRFEDHPEPEACTECLANGPFPDITDVLLDMTSPCGQCLHVTHAYSKILKHIYDEDTKRPQCYQQGWVAIPYSKPSTPTPSADELERRLLNLLNELVI